MLLILNIHIYLYTYYLLAQAAAAAEINRHSKLELLTFFSRNAMVLYFEGPRGRRTGTTKLNMKAVFRDISKS